MASVREFSDPAAVARPIIWERDNVAHRGVRIGRRPLSPTMRVIFSSDTSHTKLRREEAAPHDVPLRHTVADIRHRVLAARDVDSLAIALLLATDLGPDVSSERPHDFAGR